jgi:hypothetical protein
MLLADVSRLRAHESHNIQSLQTDNMVDSVEALIEELRPLVRATIRDRCDYRYSDRLTEIAKDYGLEKLLRTSLLQLPEDIRIGEITIRNLHEFWAALMSICEIHIAAHAIGDNGILNDLPINTIVLCKYREELVNLISQISGIVVDIVDQMLSWFTYNPQIANGVPILQPFLPLNETLFCLPSSFVNGNNFERNFMKLLNTHPDLRQFARDVEPRLEPAALDSLSELFPESRFIVMRQVVIAGITDVDLLVFEIATHCLLVIQHKWLIAPDTLRESMSNDEKLADGVRQAVRSRDYLRENPDFLRTRRPAIDHEVRDIEGVVVCRGLAGTGFLGINTAAPIVAERAFRQLVIQSENLMHLWELLNTRPDHANAERLAVERQTHLHLCGYEFVMPGLAVQIS